MGIPVGFLLCLTRLFAHTKAYSLHQYDGPSTGPKQLDFQHNFTLNIPFNCSWTHVVCEVRDRDLLKSTLAPGWQHTQQVLLPCWGLFRRYPKLVPLIKTSLMLSKKHEYTLYMIHTMGGHARDMIVEELPSTVTCAVSGGPRGMLRSGFRNREVLWLTDPADATELQSRAGLEGDSASSGGALRVGILNRVKSRSWSNAGAVVRALRSSGFITTDEEYFEAKSPAKQAAWVHAHDIIIGPHGAQMSNLIWARPCTAVLELYPHDYFLPGFYLTLALNAGALAFWGYYHDSPWEQPGQSQHGVSNKTLRQQKIDGVDVDLVVGFVSNMALSRQTCLCERLEQACNATYHSGAAIAA